MPSATDGGTEFDPAALERTEARFWRELWDAAPGEVAAAHGVRRGEFGPVQATVVADLPEARTLNLVLGAASGDAAAEGFLDEAIEWVRGVGARGFAPVAPQEPGTAAAEAALAAAGYERGRGWMRFVRDVHPPRFQVAADVEVVEVAGATRGEAPGDAPFATIAALGFGLPAWAASLLAPLPSLPDWHCYVARVDGEPVACAAMLVDGDVAELGLAATLESGRRRGCQLALLRRRIEDAAAAGARTLFVETGERVPGHPSTSYGNILRAGFEEAYVCHGWTDARTAAD
ncbi:MAG TPA: GNAT family N-acetyltransferase [Solirubrobacterales bacterium]|nr:GNAT family N-acetyltransferase [Solirubrobacterales bacterium]